jgi:hypothetical protein
VRWGEDGSRRQGPTRFTVWRHSAVASAIIEEYILLFLQVAISSNYIAGWYKVLLKNMNLSLGMPS